LQLELGPLRELALRQELELLRLVVVLRRWRKVSMESMLKLDNRPPKDHWQARHL
jgi:hypothetical protein